MAALRVGLELHEDIFPVTIGQCVAMIFTCSLLQLLSMQWRSDNNVPEMQGECISQLTVPMKIYYTLIVACMDRNASKNLI